MFGRSAANEPAAEASMNTSRALRIRREISFARTVSWSGFNAEEEILVTVRERETIFSGGKVIWRNQRPRAVLAQTSIERHSIPNASGTQSRIIPRGRIGDPLLAQ